MKYILIQILIFLLPSGFLFAQVINYSNKDPRLVSNGSMVPSETYADQPYVIVCDDGSWLCILTTSSGTEGAHMNHIISTKSYDHGKSWTYPVNVEAPGVPQSSWAVPLKVPGGRIYVFYNYNKFGFTGLEGVMSGPFMFKYSDNNGKSWSEKRYKVPIRTTKLDKNNYTNGKHHFFWSIDKPIVTNSAAYIAFSKVMRTSPDQRSFYARSEGFVLKSENILKEKKPADITWKTLPEGDTGIWSPDLGKVQAEHNLEVMNNGNLYVVNRTWDGYPTYSISTDGGKTFTKPQIMTYANGKPMGNPRACPKIHKMQNRKYLFWYHNNFNKKTYDGRNPVWMSGGTEKDGNIVWSQPEILLYTRDPAIRGMSYPDYIEQDGQLWMSETQKNVARIHKIDMDLIQGLWNQGKDTTVVRDGLIMESGEEMLQTHQINFPPLPNLINGGGFSLGLWLSIDKINPGQEIMSTLGSKHKGFRITTVDDHSLKMSLNDGQVREVNISNETEFTSDKNTITPGKLHHVVFMIDGAAKIATITVDGVLSDGGVKTRPHGWGRIYPYLRDLNDTYTLMFNKNFKGNIRKIRVYNRALRTSEAIANYNAGSN